MSIQLFRNNDPITWGRRTLRSLTGRRLQLFWLGPVFVMVRRGL